MIIVTGTKRSGTSMWMQILVAGGLPAFGEAFPRVWGDKPLREANPDGFWESSLREGVYYRTNPHPETGNYFFPEQVEGHCVKVFVQGLVRTDRAYIGRVVATMRQVREYEASLRRLWTLEDASRPEGAGPPTLPRMPPWLEWWSDNYALTRDILVRRYGVHVLSYDSLLRDPERTVHDVLKWLGRGDPVAALAAVRPGRRTQSGDLPHPDGLSPDHARIFDALFEAVDGMKGLPKSLIGELNRVQAELAPEIRRWELEYLRVRVRAQHDAFERGQGEVARRIDGPRPSRPSESDPRAET